MSDLLLLGDATTMLSLSLERTIIYGLWYSALFWLPIRGIAAMIDSRRGLAFYDEAAVDPGYCIGMNVLPPM